MTDLGMWSQVEDEMYRVKKQKQRRQNEAITGQRGSMKGME